MRQYQIFYKRGTGSHVKLTPHVHVSLYDRPEVKAAIEHMRRERAVEGMAVRLDDEQFNIITFEQEAIAPDAIVMEMENDLNVQEPIDRSEFLKKLAYTEVQGG